MISSSSSSSSSQGALTEGGLAESNLVVAKPEWFCRQVVGHLLLPENLWEKEHEVLLRRKLGEDHSMATSDFSNYFRDLNELQVTQAIAILLRLGLCFTMGTTRLLIPALVPERHSLPDWWTSTRSNGKQQWVMGFSLVPTDAEKTLIPASLFSQFQVALAQDSEIRKRIGNDFCVGSAFVTFKGEQMMVLVDYTADERNPLSHRIDIMVKPLRDEQSDLLSLKQRREKQVNFADAVLQKLDEIRQKCCPGLEFQRRVIKPWSVADGHKTMLDRDVKLLVEHLKAELDKDVKLLVEDSKAELQSLDLEIDLTEWDVYGQAVRKADLLSEGDLASVSKKLEQIVGALEEATEIGENLSTSLGILEITRPPGTSSPLAIGKAHLDTEKRSGTSSQLGRIHTMPASSMASGSSSDSFYREFLHLKAEVQEVKTEVQTLKAEVVLIKKDIQGLKMDVLEARRRQQEFLDRLTDLEITFIEEKEKSIPRFVYFTPASTSKSWLKVNDAFSNPCTLHLLCEARFGDHQFHEVENQKGYKLPQMKAWVKEYYSWIKWSITVVAVCSTVGAAFVPGLGLLVSPILGGAMLGVQTAVDQVEKATMTVATIKDFLPTEQAAKDWNRSGTTPVAVADVAKRALIELMGKLSPNVFRERFRLIRVRLLSPYKSHSKVDRQRVVWVCEDCFRKYNAAGTVQEI